MYQATSTWANCSAHITTNRNRSKIYETNQIYLKDKQNFEIELHNPTQFKVLAKININGRSISDSGIVLRPAERVYLERFIDSNNKFLFETYEVEDTKESKEAIAQNGLIEVVFYPEITTPTYSGYTFTTHNPFTTPFGNGTGDYVINNPYTVNRNGIIGTGANYSACISDNISFGGTTTNNISYYSNTVNTSSVSSSNRSLETGRVEMGESSKQAFKTTSGNFSWVPSNSISYKILPESSRPLEMSQIRNYCPGCGTRVKKASWKFCPSCGEKI